VALPNLPHRLAGARRRGRGVTRRCQVRFSAVIAHATSTATFAILAFGTAASALLFHHSQQRFGHFFSPPPAGLRSFLRMP